MNRDQITPSHRSRLACIYVRQSSPHQVLHHQESQRRQRSLTDRALELGWPKGRIVEIDTDLGRSAHRSQPRGGFERMVAETAVGHVGIILALEVARLSRGNRDWYHLLDICAITHTLIADAEGLYDPRAYDDRLLLGLKGTMSEAELHVMKQRLVEALRAKAKRGAFRFRLPPGYVWDEAGRMQKDPDEQVRGCIGEIFRRFEQLGAIHQVHCSLVDVGERVPVRSGPGLRWQRPSYDYLHRMLRNPVYAGAYVFGKRQVEEVLDAGQRPRKRVRQVERKDWHALIQGHHEGYLSWEDFERNQRQIVSNRRARSGKGAPREGESLLQGLVLCGRCGRRMKVRYGNRGRQIRYVCVRGRQQLGVPVCQSLGAIRLERAVEQLLLEALEPLGVEAMIEAAAVHAKATEAEQARCRQRVERARYEVDLARRQYEAVDPANRLVARELERRWETALRELEGVEAEAELRRQALEGPLTAVEQARLHRFAEDLASLWTASTTRVQDKKRILRCLIENVVVTVPQDGCHLKAEVHWVGGERTTLDVAKGKSGKHRYVTDGELVDLVRQLAREFTDEQIARVLSRKRLRTAKGLPFTARRVTSLRGNYGIAGTSSKKPVGDVYTAVEASELLRVNRSTVIRWVEAGLLPGTQLTAGAPWRIRVTQEDRQRLTAADAPEGWLPLKGAAQLLGVSQQTVLQRLKSGRLEGVRVQVGRRSAWRIRVSTGSYDNQSSLFESHPPSIS